MSARFREHGAFKPAFCIPRLKRFRYMFRFGFCAVCLPCFVGLLVVRMFALTLLFGIVDIRSSFFVV